MQKHKNTAQGKQSSWSVFAVVCLIFFSLYNSKINSCQFVMLKIFWNFGIKITVKYIISNNLFECIFFSRSWQIWCIIFVYIRLSLKRIDLVMIYKTNVSFIKFDEFQRKISLMRYSLIDCIVVISDRILSCESFVPSLKVKKKHWLFWEVHQTI